MDLPPTKDPHSSKPKDTLDLSYSELLEIPKDFTRFHNLSVLRLDNNKITYVPWELLMKQPHLTDWTAIRTLNLTNNQIAEVSSRLWPLFYFFESILYMDYHRKMTLFNTSATRKLYTKEGTTPLHGIPLVAITALALSFPLATDQEQGKTVQTNMSWATMWLYSYPASHPRIQLEGNPGMEKAMAAFANWKEMATSWRAEYEENILYARQPHASNEPQEDGSSNAPDDKTNRRKDHRQDTRRERRGERIKSRSHGIERDAKHGT